MGFSVGVAREDITPEVGGFLFGYNNHTRSTSVNDNLTVTALVFRSEAVSAVILSVTVCLIHETIAEEIACKIEAATGIPARNVIISCTHTHSAPRTTYFPRDLHFGDLDTDYCESILIPKYVEAAQKAAADTYPVKVGIGTTQSLAGINRRQLLPDGTVILGQNPWDTYDPTMTVITFNANGKPLANIVHIGAHLTASGNNHEITRDWAGLMADRLEAESGAVTLFLNGAQGDIAPRMANGDSVGNLQHAMEVGGLAGIDAVRAYKSIRTFYNEEMQMTSGELSLPAKEGNDVWRAKQTLLRVGPIVFVPFPFEVSAEIGLRLRAYSPFAHTLLLACTNGSNSYLPAQSQLCRGGYEVESFIKYREYRLPDDSDTRLINQNLEFINHFI
ncbi:MAG: neutral/alkaline non-lysosomal ceramidase N-terminal domain-containing protein [Defluviitaleaceae bacterium]|nr:neutral/alkaline non-lysosomal ceramidase N-terminal domain-containing protein [Defluviitaleaceae bacterium]